MGYEQDIMDVACVGGNGEIIQIVDRFVLNG
jgi:hypothetical protein